MFSAMSKGEMIKRLERAGILFGSDHDGNHDRGSGGWAEIALDLHFCFMVNPPIRLIHIKFHSTGRAYAQNMAFKGSHLKY
jgi:hypothetical protein